MLTGLLPGLREIRAPLISGYLWLAFVFLVFHSDLPSHSHPGAALRPLFELGDSLSAFGIATVSGVAAYLVGSAIQELLKLAARLFPSNKPFYAKPGTHVSFAGRDDIDHFIDIRIERIRRKLFQVALNPGERGVDAEPHLWTVERELPLIRTLLLGERPELVGELDRLQAEADLRITVAVPLAFLAVFFALEASPWWLLSLIPILLLLVQGYQRQVEVGDLLATALRIGKANAPALESLEASVDAALDRIELEEELSKKVAENNAMAAFRLGNLQASGEDFEGALSSLKYAAEHGIVRAHAEIGLVHQRLGDTEKAERAYRDGNARNEKKARELLAELLSSLDRDEEALQAVGRADDEAEEKITQQTSSERSRIADYRRRLARGDAKAGINLGLLMERRGDLASAGEAFKKATELDRDDPQAWTRLGFVERRRGLMEGANAAFSKALELLESQVGPEHLSVAPSLGNLGNVRSSLALYQEAIDLHYRALEIEERELGPDDPGVAKTLGNLGNVMLHLGRYAEARKFQERALEIEEREFGASDVEVARTLTNLGNVMHHAGEDEESLRLQERANAILDDGLGPNPDLAISLENTGNSLRALGRLEDAEDTHRRSVQIGEDAVPPLAPDLRADGIRQLGETLHALGRNDEARELLESAIALKEETLGPIHPDLAPSLSVLADVLAALGDAKGARRVRQRAREIEAVADSG